MFGLSTIPIVIGLIFIGLSILVSVTVSHTVKTINQSELSKPGKFVAKGIARTGNVFKWLFGWLGVLFLAMGMVVLMVTSLFMGVVGGIVSSAAGLWESTVNANKQHNSATALGGNLPQSTGAFQGTVGNLSSDLGPARIGAGGVINNITPPSAQCINPKTQQEARECYVRNAIYIMSKPAREQAAKVMGVPYCNMYKANWGDKARQCDFNCVYLTQAVWEMMGIDVRNSKFITPWKYAVDPFSKIYSERTMDASNWHIRANNHIKDLSRADFNPSNILPGDVVNEGGNSHVFTYFGVVDGVAWTLHAACSTDPSEPAAYRCPGSGAMHCSPNLKDKNCKEVGFVPLDYYMKHWSPPSVFHVMRPYKFLPEK